MSRFIFIEVLIFLGAAGGAYLLRRLFGRRISGPPVLLWGLLFGIIGAIATGFLLSAVSSDLNFLDLSATSPLNIVIIAVRWFWDNVLFGSLLGVLLASIPFSKKPRKPKQDEIQPRI
jgi:uncharacterized protein involved in response to NO